MLTNTMHQQMHFDFVFFKQNECSSPHIEWITFFYMHPTIGSCCFLEQETLPSLLNTGWFQERI